ncbi:MAG TPA: phosphatase PAP2 family protein [Thermoanaerobaculia bacterium]|jgi:undecaprenyl-diphosphatase
MSIDAKLRLASAAFVALLILSVFWPSPIVTANQLCCHAVLPIDELSFLGREAPAWDVVFWCITGIFALALLQDAHDFRDVVQEFRATRLRIGMMTVVAVLGAAIVVAVIWIFADSPVTAWSERIASDEVQNWIRIANRFGGGMNPVMIIGFFLLAGLAYGRQRWVGYAIRMTLAGAAGGVLVQLMKFAVGRTRAELWLGPFHHARASASSFPSGHTVGAFALAGVLIFNSESKTLRVAAALLAFSVALSRVLAFRHWTSDVAASAAIGLIVAATLPFPRSSR